MPSRIVLLCLSLVLLTALVGCGGGAEPAAIPTVAALPTITPIQPTNTPVLPPTWTPAPTAVLTCDRLIAQTAQSAQRVCADLETGQACFVADRAGLTLRPVNDAPAFAAPGDRINQTLFSRIDTTAYDPLSSTWGMALLNVQADPPGVASGQWVMVALYGEATVFDAGNGTAPFQSMNIHTGFADPQCAEAPLPGVLIQNPTGVEAEVTINGLPVRFDGTLFVRAQGQGSMVIAVLSRSAQVTADGIPLTAPAGTELHTFLGGEDGYTISAPVTLEPLDTTRTAFLPLVALPRAVAVGPPVLETRAPDNNPDMVATPVLDTPTPTATSVLPFEGTPPGGAFLTYGGKRLDVLGNVVTGTVPENGSDSWVFTPHGLGPDSFDYFEVTAFGEWDPVLTIESATWGPYETDYDGSPSEVEVYAASLAGSGGDWRIVIRDTLGRGGAYTIRYTCQGPCPPLE
jgi:hypothetical protein